MIKKTILFGLFSLMFVMASCMNKDQKETLQVLKELNEEGEKHEEVTESNEKNGALHAEVDGESFEGRDLEAILMGSEKTEAASRALLVESYTDAGGIQLQFHFKPSALKEGTYKANSRALMINDTNEKNVYCLALFDDLPAEDGTVTISELNLDSNPNTVSGSYAFQVQQSNGKLIDVKGEFSDIGIYKMMGATLD